MTAAYLHDKEDKKKWVVDEQAAKVIRRIFDLCMAGRGSSQIARILWKEKVPTPTAHYHAMGIKRNHSMPANPYCWKDTTVDGILSRMEYLGHMVNFKWHKKSDKKKMKREIIRANRRIMELDLLFKRIYEDSLCQGRMSNIKEVF